MAVDTDQLMKVLGSTKKMDASKGTKTEFVLSSDHQQPSYVNSIHLFELGAIPFPISLKNFHLMRRISEPILSGRGLNKQLEHSVVAGHEMDGSKLISIFPGDFSSSTLPHLISIVTQHLGIPTETISVKAELIKLLLFQVGDHQSCPFDQDMRPGTIGTLIIRLPVENGHQGGRIVLAHCGKVKHFDTDTQSGRAFQWLAFHSSCQQVLESISEGAAALLVYRLVWTNAPSDQVLRHLNIPAFIEFVNELKNVLRSWDSLDTKLTLDVDPDDSCDYDGCNSFRHASCGYCGRRSESEDETNGEEGFIIPLKHRYDLDGWSFSSLKGEDRVLAMLFQSCPSAAIHLVMISQIFKDEDLPDGDSSAGYEDEEPSYGASNWIGLEGPVRLIGMGDYVSRRIIGKEETRPERDPDRTRKTKDPDCDGGMLRELTYLTPALCVWPKKRSMAFYCNYGFDAFLDRLERSTGDGLETLKSAMYFIGRNAEKVWRDPATGGADRAERLFRLCVKFQAKEEGVKLLGLINSECYINYQYVYEGIRNEKVAEAIAEFQCLVAGWEACSKSILSLVQKCGIKVLQDQLAHFVTLVRFLLKSHCFNGALQVEQAITSSILACRGLKLTPFQLEVFFKLGLDMDLDVKTADPQRVPRIVSFFNTRMDTFQQCSVMVHLARQHSSEPIFLELMNGLVSSGDFGSSSRIEEVIVKLLICTLKTTRPALVDKLMAKLVGVPRLVKAVVSSSEIWTLATMDFIGKPQLVALLPQLVKTRIGSLADLVEKNPDSSEGSSKSPSCFDPTWLEHKKKDDGQIEEVRRSLAFGLTNVIQLVSKVGLSVPEGLAVLDPLLSKMGRERLCQLVVDVYHLDQEQWGSARLFIELCRSVKLPATDNMDPDLALGILKVFGHLDTSESFLSPLVDVITKGAPADVLEAVVSRFKLWVNKSPKLVLVVQEAVSKLLKAWIHLLNTTGTQAEVTTFTNALIQLKKEPFRPDVDQSDLSRLIGRWNQEDLFAYLFTNHGLSRTGLKEEADCIELYCYLVLSFLQGDGAVKFVSSLPAASEVLKCLLWLGDLPCVESFIALLSKAPDGDLLAIQLALSEKFRQFVDPPQKNYYASRPSLTPVDKAIGFALLDHCAELVGHLLPSGNVWKQSQAVVRGRDPELESFLRSERREMTLRGFIRLPEAREFHVKFLQDAPTHGYHVKAEVKGTGTTSRIEIVKILQAIPNDLSKKCSDLQGKADALVSLRGRLGPRPELGAQRAIGEENNEAKRRKL